MKFNLKEKLETADDDILSEVIEACEQKMTSKFKPKAEVSVLEVEEHDEEQAKPKVTKEELADADVEDLLELFKGLKG